MTIRAKSFAALVLLLIAALGILLIRLRAHPRKSPAPQSPLREVVHPTAPATPIQEPAPPAPPEPAVHDPKLAALLDRDAENRVLPDMPARIPEARAEDFPALLAVVRDTSDDDTVRHEVIELLRRSHCPELPAALLQVLNNPFEGPRFRGFVTQHLGTLAEQAALEPDLHRGVLAAMQKGLGDRHFTVRCQALQNLCRLQDPAGQRTTAAWLAHYEPECIDESGQRSDPELERGAILHTAIHCAETLELKALLPEIRAFAHDKNAVIRIAALVVLCDWADRASLEAMRDAANSSSTPLRKCGEACLARMTGN